MMDDMNGWWMLWGSLMMLVFWGGLAALVIWGLRSLLPSGRSPLDIARERYARGEITSEQFAEIQKGLAAGLR